MIPVIVREQDRNIGDRVSVSPTPTMPEPASRMSRRSSRSPTTSRQGVLQPCSMEPGVAYGTNHAHPRNAHASVSYQLSDLSRDLKTLPDSSAPGLFRLTKTLQTLSILASWYSGRT